MTDVQLLMADRIADLSQRLATAEAERDDAKKVLGISLDIQHVAREYAHEQQQRAERADAIARPVLEDGYRIAGMIRPAGRT
jgi:glycosyltransferase A (GT-A) superfamily protein (DUF2064 family)